MIAAVSPKIFATINFSIATRSLRREVIFKPILMHMKAKHTILLIALGFCLDYIGSLSQIMHRSEARVLFILATLLKVVGIVWLAYKVVTYEGFRRFMER